jgi:hypothetical protein
MFFRRDDHIPGKEYALKDPILPPSGLRTIGIRGRPHGFVVLIGAC